MRKKVQELKIRYFISASIAASLEDILVIQLQFSCISTKTTT